MTEQEEIAAANAAIRAEHQPGAPRLFYKEAEDIALRILDPFNKLDVGLKMVFEGEGLKSDGMWLVARVYHYDK